MLPAPPRFPRQHGAWVMLAIPALLGLALTRGGPGAGWWAIPGLLFGFLAQDALVQAAHARGRSPREYVRRRWVWGLLYLGAAGLAFLGLVAGAPAQARPAVLQAAVPAAVAAGIWSVHSMLRRGRALWSELIGMAGVALAAPLMAAAAGLPLAGRPLGAAAVAFAYCLSSVTSVRAYERRRTAPALSAWVAAGVHVLLLVGIVLLVRAGALSALAALAFLPVVLRVGVGVLSPPRDLRALGMRELWVAASFTALSVVGFWLSA
jgi:hypothetical protein